MNKHRTNAINTSATSKQVREPMDRELTADELDHVTGGKPSAAPKDDLPTESLSLNFTKIMYTFTP
jgi:hypothetical protein